MDQQPCTSNTARAEPELEDSELGMSAINEEKYETACWSLISFDLPEYPLQRNAIPIGEMIKELDDMQKHFKLHGNNMLDKDNIIMVFEILYILEIDGHKIITNSSSSSAQIEDVCKIIRSIESNGIKTVNLYSALKYLRELAQDEVESKYQGLIDVNSFILEMHRRILGSDNRGGKFSTKDRFGIVDPHTDEIHKYPKFDTVEQVERTVELVADHYNALFDKIRLSYNEDSKTKSATENLFKLSALLLFKITYYHPFGDGNGRLARLLSSYALFLNAPFPTPMYGLFSPSTKSEYVDALVEARKNNGIPSTLTALIIESSYYTWKRFNEVVRMASMGGQTWKELLISCANIAKMLKEKSELQSESA